MNRQDLKALAFIVLMSSVLISLISLIYLLVVLNRPEFRGGQFV